MADEKHPIEAGGPKTLDVVREHRRRGPRLHLNKSGLPGRGMFEDEIGVGLVAAADGRGPAPAAIGEDEINQEFKVPPVELLDQGSGAFDELRPRRLRFDHHRLFDAVDPAKQIGLGLDPTEGLAIGGDFREPGRKAFQRQRTA